MESLVTCEKGTSFVCERGKLTTNTAKHHFFQVNELQACKCFFFFHSSRKVLPACFRFSSYRLRELSAWCLLFVIFLDLQFNLDCNFRGAAFCQRNYLKISAFSIDVHKTGSPNEPLPKRRKMAQVHHTWSTYHIKIVPRSPHPTNTWLPCAMSVFLHIFQDNNYSSR